MYREGDLREEFTRPRVSFFFGKNQCQLGSTSSYVIFALFQTHFPTTKPYSRKGAIKISPQDENEPKHVQPSKVQI